MKSLRRRVIVSRLVWPQVLVGTQKLQLPSRRDLKMLLRPRQSRTKNREVNCSASLVFIRLC